MGITGNNGDRAFLGRWESLVMGITSNNDDRAFLELYRKVAVTSNNDDTAFLKRWASMAVNGLKICFKIDTVSESFETDTVVTLLTECLNSNCASCSAVSAAQV